eukprot:3844922-Pleurochrysis_carterae.AAC.2
MSRAVWLCTKTWCSRAAAEVVGTRLQLQRQGRGLTRLATSCQRCKGRGPRARERESARGHAAPGNCICRDTLTCTGKGHPQRSRLHAPLARTQLPSAPDDLAAASRPRAHMHSTARAHVFRLKTRLRVQGCERGAWKLAPSVVLSEEERPE